MMSRFLLLLFALNFIFCAVSVAQETKNMEIIPAKSVGKISIGASFQDWQLGQPSFSKEVSGGRIVKFSDRALIVQYSTQTGMIQFIGIERSSVGGNVFATKDNLTVGSTKQQVEAVYGNADRVVPVVSKDIYPHSEQMAIYAGRGISFHYDAKGIVTVILVFNPSLFGA